MVSATSNRTEKSRRNAAFWAYWLSRLQQTRFQTPFGVIALLLGGLGCGIMLVALGTTAAFMATALAGCLAVLFALVIFDQFEVLAAICAAASLLVDWYQPVKLLSSTPFAAATLTLSFIALLFLLQSRSRPWQPFPYLWAWIVFLLMMLAVFVRSPDLTQAFVYLDNILLLPLLMWILGVQLGRTIPQIRKLLSLLTFFGALIGLHALIEALTGKFLFETAAYQNGLTTKGAYFSIAGTSIIRTGSFMGNPNSAGQFFTALFFIALTATLSSTSARGRILHGMAAVVILLGMFFSFSTTSWIATAGGILLFIVLVGSMRIRLLFGLAVGGGAALLWVIFPARVSALISHTLHPTGLSGRLEAWATALNVIRALPLTGIGLGVGTAYIHGVAPYRANPAQPALTHPQDSFLEFAVMGGLPLVLAFLILLGAVVRRLWRNYRAAPREQRVIFCGILAMVVAISINALGDAAWTFPPLAGILWLVIGAGSSFQPGQRAVSEEQDMDGLADADNAEPEPIERALA